MFVVADRDNDEERWQVIANCAFYMDRALATMYDYTEGALRNRGRRQVAILWLSAKTYNDSDGSFDPDAFICRWWVDGKGIIKSLTGRMPV